MAGKRNDDQTDKLKRYMRLPAKRKLEYLQQMNEFLRLAMPASSKHAWKVLKEKNW